MRARNHIIPVFVPHLGCPWQCVFCDQHRISGAEEPATPGDVRAAVDNAVKLGIPEPRELAFYGGSFTAIPDDQQIPLLETAKQLLDKGMIQAIRLSTRPDAISDDILKRLKKSGVGTVELGAQSLDDDVLLQSGRGHTARDVINASHSIKSLGFHLILQMMTGLPGDSDAKDIATAEKIIALKPDGVRIYPTVIVKDTPLYYCWKNGSYAEHTVEDAVRVCAHLLPLFEAAGIPVIRLGLNPTEELSEGEAQGGAYHPALGELVKSRVLLNRVRSMMDRETADRELIIHVRPELVSQMTGQHRCNLNLLKEEYRLSDVRVIPDRSAEIYIEIK